MINYIIPENELYHFGIKGQKWGIRRFQNEDGSYTQAGLKRYGRLKSEYEETKSKAREALKTGDYKYYEYKGKAKRQKKYVKQAYKDLKRYSKIDKGAKLYAQGKRIHENGRKMTLVMMASSGGMYMSKFIKDRKVRTAVQAGIGVVSALVEGQTMYENDKLRAYYGRYEGGLKLDKKKGEVYKI